MLRRARSQSASEGEDGEKKAEGATAAAKRKLSTSEPQKPSKKAKKDSEVDDEDNGDEEGEEGGESGKDEEEEEAEDDKRFNFDDDDDEEEEEEEDRPARSDPDSKAYKIDGPGPHVFFLWADAIYHVLRMGPGDDIPYVVLKSAATDAFAPLAHLSKEEAADECPDDEYLELIKTWRIILVKDAAKTPQAKALQEVWKKLLRESHKRKEDADDKGWWYEVMFQREKPEEGSPGLEVKLEGTGTQWWFTDIQPSDDAGDRAMSCIVNYTASAYD